MKKTSLVLIAAAMVLGSVAVVAILAAMRPQPEVEERPAMAEIVDVLPIETAHSQFQLRSQGTVQPRTETQLVAEVSGKVTRIANEFVAGGLFQADQVLVEIDPSDYRNTLSQAQAELKRLRAAHRLARQQLDRFESLYHRKNISKSDLEQRQSEAEQTQAAIQSQQALVQQARRDLERTRIHLPYDGLVKERSVDLGQFVAAGNPLGTAFSVKEAEIRLPLSQQDSAFIDLPRPGYQPASLPEVTLQARVGGRMMSWPGEIVRTEGVVDERTRLIYAVARVPDPYHLEGDGKQPPLPIGTFVSARIQGRSAEGLVVLPRVALRNGDQVYVADSDNKLAIREVQVVRSTPEQVYTNEAFQPGDRAVITAIQTPIPGMALKIRDLDANQEDSEPSAPPPVTSPGEHGNTESGADQGAPHVVAP
ncbi:membrane-fusion protein [Alcanivorax xiamenensis]|uniref:Membrane-fusion protein n=1 Tax=Alcanivorax xiamenensis TaxID=1177156 RepID=A0ABQ6YBK6_9GAMM|nr:efflux RND transporter periplasmic adaptor subunit [Alcanivorax xiamenensis]KAF0806928.1 membrane-fusion protein [Alcanivorax xiamenensis]